MVSRPAGARPDVREISDEGRPELGDGRQPLVGVGVDDGEQNLLELRGNLGIGGDARPQTGKPRPAMTWFMIG